MMEEHTIASEYKQGKYNFRGNIFRRPSIYTRLKYLLRGAVAAGNEVR